MTPIVIGYKVVTTDNDSELDKKLDNLCFLGTDSNAISICAKKKDITVEDIKSKDEDYIYYYDEETAGAKGLGPCCNCCGWKSAIRLTQDELEQYNEWNLIGVNVLRWGDGEHTGMIEVFGEGTPSQPGPIITSTPYYFNKSDWFRVNLNKLVPIKEHNEIWIAVNWTTKYPYNYPAAVDEHSPVIGKSDWIYLPNSEWLELYQYGFYYSWCMEAIVQKGETLYVGGGGEGNYTKIQDAINDADGGDTVFVYDDSSPYYENILVDKSINLIGENRDTTVIDGSGSGNVIKITNDSATIRGFTIQNSGSNSWDAGLEIHSNLSEIIGNIIINCNIGIFPIPEDDCPWVCCNVFAENTIKNNKWGIRLLDTRDTIIGDNSVTNNDVGIGLSLTDIPINNDYPIISNHNINICNNKIKNNDLGIAIGDMNKNNIYENEITDNEGGILLLDGWDNNIYKNNISGNNYGVEIASVYSATSNNNIYQNNIINNNQGIYFTGIFEYPTNNFIYQNNILYNLIGLYLPSSFLKDGIIKNNYFFQNNYIGNILYGALITGKTGENHWDDKGTGNYWDEYIGTDSNGDGIGDTPYIIKKSIFGENIDNYPLMEPYGDVPDVKIKNKSIRNFSYLFFRFLEMFPILHRLLSLLRVNL